MLMIRRFIKQNIKNNNGDKKNEGSDMRLSSWELKVLFCKTDFIEIIMAYYVLHDIFHYAISWHMKNYDNWVRHRSLLSVHAIVCLLLIITDYSLCHEHMSVFIKVYKH